VDRLLLECDPSPAIVSALRRWIDVHPEAWGGTGWHTTMYRPARWQGVDHWPAEMPTQPGHDTSPVPQSRDDVTRVARRCRVSGTWLELLVAVIVWGHKSADYGPSRLSKMLQCNCHREVSEEQRQQRLASAVSILDDHGPVAGYRALRGDHRVPHLGPAFFSKILYFADASIDRVDDKRASAIILDRKTSQKMISVARDYISTNGLQSLERDEAVKWVWDRRNWTGHRYGIYCQWAGRCAQYMARAHGWPQKPDLIELALFTMPEF
jgi:Putative 8-oxoguanine DNA glycosylase OGG-like protein